MRGLGRCRTAAWLVLGVVLGLVSVGCGDDDDDDTDGTTAIANPASVYCQEQGGTVKIVTASDGSQSGLCQLADGTEIDEWEFYRKGQAASTTSEAAAPTTPTTSPTTGPTEPTETSTVERPVVYDVFLLAGGDACDTVVASPRTSTVEGVLGEAMSQLLAGPTPAETAKGLRSWFVPATAGMLQSVTIEDGIARISFAAALRSTIPNASTSCGSAGLLAQLDATATQFRTVDRAIYALDGDVDAFYQWLQLTSPTT